MLLRIVPPLVGLLTAVYMLRASGALELAANGMGHTRPNPMVGAVLVKDGEIIGEGWHEFYGGPHAEVNALPIAGLIPPERLFM